MNILSASWTWHQVGGDWTYVDNVNKLYKQYGHNVIPFSMKSPRNIDAGPFEKYFVENIDYKELNKQKSLSNSFKAASRTIYSSEAKDNITQLLADYKVDAAHLHNIHHYLTPSILPVLKKKDIPIFWTLHDYTILCPENSFVSHGKICEKCKGGKFVNCAINKCKKNSFMASSLAALENYTHRYLNVFKHVDYFLCPSEFLKNKFVEFGFPEHKMITVNYCIDIKDDEPHQSSEEINPAEDYILYLGRLEKIKGIYTLLDAVKKVNTKIKLLGTGGLLEEVKEIVEKEKRTNVEILGHKSRDEVHDIVKGAKFLICPSEWYENYPFAVIESLFLGKAVVGSKIGGIPEMVLHNQTGLLFEPFNADDLAEKINYLLANEHLQKEYGNNGAEIIRKKLSYSTHYSLLKDVYSKVGLSL